MSAHKWEHVCKRAAHGRWSGTCGPPVFSITADMSPGRYMFPPAASAHALPGEEEVLSWKRLAMKLVVFFPPLYFSFWIFVLTVSVPASAVELDGTGGQRSVRPGK